MYKLGFLAFCITALMGCATSPISADKAESVPASRMYAFNKNTGSQLVVTRDTGFFGAGCNHRFYIDGTLAAEFASGEIARFGVLPGRHVVGVKPSAACGGGGLTEAEVEVRSGESVRRRLSVTPGGLAISPTSY